jgi:hypothetical protein
MRDYTLKIEPFTISIKESTNTFAKTIGYERGYRGIITDKSTSIEFGYKFLEGTKEEVRPKLVSWAQEEARKYSSEKRKTEYIPFSA